jgi:hypothetical protein
LPRGEVHAADRQRVRERSDREVDVNPLGLHLVRQVLAAALFGHQTAGFGEHRLARQDDDGITE